MSILVLQPTSTAQWHKLVREAEASVDYELGEELESYLVFLLIRFAKNPTIVSNILALEYMHGLLEKGTPRCDKLRDVGDQCLLFSGLFPNIVERRQVKLTYFVELGRGAYSELSNALRYSLAEIYAHLAKSFLVLMDVLQAMRNLDSAKSVFDPLQSFQIWEETGGRTALRSLRRYTKAIPISGSKDTAH